MKSRLRAVFAFGALASITACAAIFGISDPEIEPAGSVEGGTGDGGPDVIGDATVLPDGKLVCPTGFGDCNGNPSDGCEEPLTTNPAHCGACGHSCLTGGLCTGGRCQPIMISQPDAGDCSGFVALDAENVYFNAGEQKAVLSVPKTGGPTKTWITFPTGTGGREAADGIYVDGAFVAGSHYYSRNFAVARDGGPQYAIGNCSNTVLGITVDDTGKIYSMNAEPCGGGGGAIRQYTAPDGGLVEQWVINYGPINTAEPQWLAFDATHVFYIGERTTPSEGIYRATRSAGSDKKLLVDGGAYTFGPSPLLLDGNRIYARRDNAIISIDKATGATTDLATGINLVTLIGTAYPRTSIAFDATHVYFTARDGTDRTMGKIMRVGKTAGSPVDRMVGGLKFGFSVAVDDVAIYFTTAEGVFRLAK